MLALLKNSAGADEEEFEEDVLDGSSSEEEEGDDEAEIEGDNAEEEELKDLTAETIGNDHHLDWYHGEKEMTSRMLTDIFQASIKDVTKIQNLFFKL